MTLVVQLTVPDGWPVHVTWAAMALGIMAWGRGGFRSTTGSRPTEDDGIAGEQSMIPPGANRDLAVEMAG